jgi:6,7-dimethyl-8-ribityllumazine synthase
VKTIEGTISASKVRLTLVASRFNDFINRELIRGATEAFERFEGDPANLTLVRVPGAFEIPSVTRRVARQGETDAIVCLGTVIRGSTPHFDYIAAEVSKGIAHVAFEASIPVIYGILTVDSIEQAVERAGTKMGNRGYESVLNALEMLSLYRQLG